MSTLRVAFPTNDRMHVEEHFGHCKEFVIYTLNGKTIANTEFVTPPPHAPGVIPNFLNAQHINVIITGGMGQMAINMFKDNGVEVILGAVGTVEANLKEFMSGILESTGSACTHNHGEDHDCSH